MDIALDKNNQVVTCGACGAVFSFAPPGYVPYNQRPRSDSRHYERSRR